MGKTAEEYAYNIRLSDADIVDALYEQIQRAMEVDNVPEELRDEVFNIVNSRCEIRVNN